MKMQIETAGGKEKNMKREEKIPFLKAILFMAKVDQDTDPAELAYYQTLGVEIGFGADEVSHIQTAVLSGKETLEEYLDQIQERSTKLQLLYQMMTIACTDGRIEEAEYDKIKGAAEYLGVQEEKVKEIVALVKESEELKKKRTTILEIA